MKKILFSPVTHFNLIVIGFFCIIQTIHTQAHYAMDSDPNSYCYSLYKKNPDLLNRHKYDWGEWILNSGIVNIWVCGAGLLLMTEDQYATKNQVKEMTYG